MQEHRELLAGDSGKIPLLLLRLNTDLSDFTDILTQGEASV